MLVFKASNSVFILSKPSNQTTSIIVDFGILFGLIILYIAIACILIKFMG